VNRRFHQDRHAPLQLPRPARTGGLAAV